MISYDDVYYSNIPGGFFDGALAIFLELGDQNHCSLEELTNSILKFNKTLLLRILGNDKATTQEDLTSFIQTMKENGYSIQGTFHGSDRPPWLDLVSYRIVTITEEPWLSYSANEIHYQPRLKVDIKPPLLQQVHRGSILYIDSHREIAPRELFDFIMRFPTFRVFSSPSKVYRMPVEIVVND
jgi:hypothetical protein